MDPREQVVVDALKLYCPPDGNLLFKRSGNHIIPVPGRCEPDKQIQGQYGPVPEWDIMMAVWANMLKQNAMVYAAAYDVFRNTPKKEWSGLGKGFLVGLGMKEIPDIPIRNPAAERWMEKLNDFNGRMYDYEVIIKALYTGQMEGIPKPDKDCYMHGGDPEKCFDYERAAKHHFSGEYKGKHSIDMPQMFLDLVVKPVLLGTTASLGQAASTYYPNRMPYSKVGARPDVATPLNLLAELQTVSKVGKKIASSSFPWLAAKSQEWMQDGQDLLEDRLTKGAVDLASVARTNVQDGAALKALADKEFEDYAGRAKTKIRSGVMPIAALGGLALLLVMKGK